MLTDKQIEEISKASADISVAVGKHPLECMSEIIFLSSDDYHERRLILKKCTQWLFDNQQPYPFSISKEDMIY